jgi:chemotaxis protein methyltransferase CheR
MSEATPLRESATKGMQQLAKLAYEQIGLDLRAGKEGLITSRLSKPMREHGVGSMEAYCSFVQNDVSGKALTEMIDALTTNHTSFFRESKHFDFLKELAFPAWRQRREVHVWSAACSTGEEPYSLAMTALEHLGPAAESMQILATDISTRVLATARKGLYRHESFPKPLVPWMGRYLLRGKNHFEGWYQVKPEVRRMIHFEHINLVKPLEVRQKFAAIFCRNVMIYFDRPTQEQVVNRLAACLEPGGYFFVGHSESLSGVKHTLQYVRPATYRKDGDGGRA